MVEVPGIEPGSSGIKISLLRAQCAYRFLSSSVFPHQSLTNSVVVKFPLTPTTLLADELYSDARFRTQSVFGLTDFGASLCSQGEISSFITAVQFFAEFWLTRSSQLPRPASLIPTNRVETVHPQYLQFLREINLGSRSNFHYLVFVLQSRLAPLNIQFEYLAPNRFLLCAGRRILPCLIQPMNQGFYFNFLLYKN